MRDLYFICECARVPAVTNLLYNNNAKVELLESSPRAGLRAFEKKKRREKVRECRIQRTIAQGWFWVKKRENRHPKQGGKREIDDKELK